MRAEVRAFVVEQLADMNYDVEGIDDDTTLGPSGVDLESLALADLSVRVEDRYGLTFADDESEKLALMTVGEFTTMVADRVAEATSDNSLMSGQPDLGRADLLTMLAELTAKPAAEVPDRIGSMELAWLVHLVEQRYERRLDLTDDELAGIRTVDDALAVFRASLTAPADG